MVLEKKKKKKKKKKILISLYFTDKSSRKVTTNTQRNIWQFFPQPGWPHTLNSPNSLLTPSKKTRGTACLSLGLGFVPDRVNSWPFILHVLKLPSTIIENSSRSVTMDVDTKSANLSLKVSSFITALLVLGEIQAVFNVISHEPKLFIQSIPKRSILFSSITNKLASKTSIPGSFVSVPCEFWVQQLEGGNLSLLNHLWVSETYDNTLLYPVISEQYLDEAQFIRKQNKIYMYASTSEKVNMSQLDKAVHNQYSSWRSMCLIRTHMISKWGVDMQDRTQHYLPPCKKYNDN